MRLTEVCVLILLSFATVAPYSIRKGLPEPRPLNSGTKVSFWNFIVFESIYGSCAELKNEKQKFQDKYRNGYCSILKKHCSTIGTDRGSSDCKVSLSAEMLYDLCCVSDGGIWSSWTEYAGMCSKQCGYGYQYVTRTRRCVSATPCQGQSRTQTIRSCQTQTCTRIVNGGWSQWNTWIGSCSVSCGGGRQSGTRTRSCTDPRPSGGGRRCSGPSREPVSKSCNTHACGTVNFACGRRAPTPKIVNGSVAGQCELPWTVGLRSGGQFICGAVLIDRTHILTAAHCAEKPDLSVEVGKYYTDSSRNTDAQVISVPESGVRIHENFRIRRTYLNDIAMLTLPRPVDYSYCKKPICLPPADRRPYVGQQCLVAGWGYLQYGVFKQPEQLMKVELTVYNSAECREKFFENQSVVDDGVLCAANGMYGMKDSCKGDSGGPLICEFDGVWELIGIVSTGRKCAVPKETGFYAFVPYYRDWIDDKLRN